MFFFQDLAKVYMTVDFHNLLTLAHMIDMVAMQVGTSIDMYTTLRKLWRSKSLPWKPLSKAHHVIKNLVCACGQSYFFQNGWKPVSKILIKVSFSWGATSWRKTYLPSKTCSRSSGSSTVLWTKCCRKFLSEQYRWWSTETRVVGKWNAL